MALIGTVPRRCVNLPPGSLTTLLGASLRGTVGDGPAIDAFERQFADWLGAPYALGAGTGRSAFQLALESLDMPQGGEIIFPAFTFPVMPMVAKLLGFVPVFCPVDPHTFNSGPAEIEPLITDRTCGVLATHLFGRPCPIGPLAELTRARGIRLMEDCAHACGVRVDGRSVGTFGDVGVFSFAQGKNMPCLGGGAIAVMDDAVAERARAILADAAAPEAAAVRSEAFSIWIKWLLTRPLVFGLSAYPALRLKLALGKPLMDSAVGNQLIDKYRRSDPKVDRLANLQAQIGLLQLQHIDAFNAGARRNGEVLTEELADVPGVEVPERVGDHIYVYYPLKVDARRRDDLRDHLLRHGIDAKLTDMSDCATLDAFSDGETAAPTQPPMEAAVLEICVYPVLSERQMRRIASVIRGWARSSSSQASGASAAPSAG